MLVFFQELIVFEFFGFGFLRLLLLGSLLLGELADEAFVLGQPLLLVLCLLLIFQLQLEGPPLLSELLETLFFLVTLSLLLADELFSHFGLDTAGVEVILVDYLQSPMLSLLI